MLKLSDISFRYRLSATFGTLILFIAFVTFLTATSIDSLKEEYSTINDNQDTLYLITETHDLFNYEETAFDEFLISENLLKLNESSASYDKLNNDLTTLARLDEIGMESDIIELQRLLDRIPELQDTILLAVEQNDTVTRDALLNTQYFPLTAQINTLFQRLEGQQYSNIDKIKASFVNKLSIQGKYVVMMLLFVMVLTVIIASVLMKGISLQLKELVELAEQASQGDFTGRSKIHSQDEFGELGRAFNTMSVLIQHAQNKLQDEVKKTTDALTQTLDQVGQQNEQLSNTQQAVINVLSDVEDEKQNVEQEKVKVELIIENIADGVLIIDKNHSITLLNKAAREMLQLDLVEALTMQLEDLIKIYTEDDSELIDNEQFIAYQVIKSLKEKDDEMYVLHRADHSRFTARMSASPLVFNGVVTGVVVVFRDVTREQIIDRQKTEFISVASHQLRTPLSSIKWFLEMVLNGDAGDINDEQKDFLTEAYQSNERMIVLVGDLLNVSRIEQGRVGIEPVPTNVKVLVDSIVQELRHSIEEKQQEFTMEVGKDIPEEIVIDPKLVRQAIHNLLTNAIKYTQETGKVSVDISRKDEFVQIAIEDTGYGIPKESQSSIFKKFFRATNVISKETEGNGLGMYVTKSIIESSGGKVWFESEEHKGSTFFITLPVEGSIAKEGEVSLL